MLIQRIFRGWYQRGCCKSEANIWNVVFDRQLNGPAIADIDDLATWAGCCTSMVDKATRRLRADDLLIQVERGRKSERKSRWLTTVPAAAIAEWSRKNDCT